MFRYPKLSIWGDVCRHLTAVAQRRGFENAPPTPPLLDTDPDPIDVQRTEDRWRETVRWARRHELGHVVVLPNDCFEEHYVSPAEPAWRDVHDRLSCFANLMHVVPPAEPPRPYAHVEPKTRQALWNETVEWAAAHGLARFTELPAEAFIEYDCPDFESWQRLRVLLVEFARTSNLRTSPPNLPDRGSAPAEVRRRWAECQEWADECGYEVVDIPRSRFVKIYTCPVPPVWADVHQHLAEITSEDDPDTLPWPLILHGWQFSSAYDKHFQWLHMVAWAQRHGAQHVTTLPPSVMAVWNYNEPPDDIPEYEQHPRARIPTNDEVRWALTLLREQWTAIVGPQLSRCTRPLRLTGRRRRRLVVEADERHTPAWGTWERAEDRRSFHEFRVAVNSAIAPLEVDHIDFIIRHPHEGRFDDDA